MGETLLTSLSIEKYHPSTVLSMDSSSSSHEETERDGNRSGLQSGPPDINIPLSVELSVVAPETQIQTQLWNDTCCEMLDVSLGPQVYEGEAIVSIPKVGRKCAKRVDTIWGAWFFFNYYFKPVLKEISKCKVTNRDGNGWTGFDKSDLRLDAFLVQHDMENIYMWVFKERPDNALGKMQLRSFMNGHSRQGERPFPFSVDRGFVRSHKMQRKHYRGLSNPQCVHGIQLVTSPDLLGLDDSDKKRWMELTGRDLNFSIPQEAGDFGSWRNLPPMEFELERPALTNAMKRKLIPDTALNFASQAQPTTKHLNANGVDLAKKQKKDTYPNGINDNGGFLRINPHSDGGNGIVDVESHSTEPVWGNEFSGVMKNVYGPVTAAKSIYEDEQGFLIVVSLPFADLQRVRVTWKNTPTHGIVKVACVSTARSPLIKRHGRTFKLTDTMSEHCPPGEFIRQISLPTRIPDDAKLEAYCDETGTVLEIMVPKQHAVPEEHEVLVCLRPSPWV